MAAKKSSLQESAVAPNFADAKLTHRRENLSGSNIFESDLFEEHLFEEQAFAVESFIGEVCPPMAGDVNSARQPDMIFGQHIVQKSG